MLAQKSRRKQAVKGGGDMALHCNETRGRAEGENVAGFGGAVEFRSAATSPKAAGSRAEDREIEVKTANLSEKHDTQVVLQFRKSISYAISELRYHLASPIPNDAGRRIEDPAADMDRVGNKGDPTVVASLHVRDDGNDSFKLCTQTNLLVASSTAPDFSEHAEFQRIAASLADSENQSNDQLRFENPPQAEENFWESSLTRPRGRC
ncbi:hypothetical protein BJV78DRAFT_1153041 [Lactifluus subvellereus]|nr:hypothetical protein BJV78DRAFT_1153041 [Lactifluus subvellereus]